MSLNDLVGMILFGAIAGAVIILGALQLIARFLPDDVVTEEARKPSRISIGTAGRYVDFSPEPRPAPSLPSRPVAEGRKEGSEKPAPEAAPGIVHITEKALQLRLREAYENGAMDVYAALLKGGHLDAAVQARKVGAIKATIHELAGRHTPIFGAGGGGSLQRFNRLLDEVPVPPPPAEARRIPISDGKAGYVELGDDEPDPVGDDSVEVPAYEAPPGRP